MAWAFCLDASLGVFTFASITVDRGATFTLTVYRSGSCTSKWRLTNVAMSHDMATAGPGSPNKTLNKLIKKNLGATTIRAARFALDSRHH